MMATYEGVFYYSHRLLHAKPFYARINKTHHEWKAPTAIAAAYAHPIEHLLSNVLPSLSLFFSTSGTSFWKWVALYFFLFLFFNLVLLLFPPRVVLLLLF